MLSADWERTESEKNVCDALEVVANEIGAKQITSGEGLKTGIVTISRTHMFPLIQLQSPMSCTRPDLCFPSSVEGRSSTFSATSRRWKFRLRMNTLSTSIVFSHSMLDFPRTSLGMGLDGILSPTLVGIGSGGHFLSHFLAESLGRNEKPSIHVTVVE